MLVSVTLNPSIDKTMVVENFKLNATNRAKSERIDLGSKGINVAKAAKTLDADITCIGFMFEKKGGMFKEDFKNRGIKYDFIMCRGEVRTNIKVVDPKNNTMTEINGIVPSVNDQDIQRVKGQVEKYAAQSSLMVFAGSLPSGVADGLYRELIEICSKYPIKCYLDTSGDALREGIKAQPFMIKPNLSELEQLLSAKISCDEEVIEGAREIAGSGVECVVVSLGERGAIAVFRNKVYRVKPLRVKAVGTVGAGDSLLTGIAVAMDRTGDFEYALKLGSACAASSVTKEGTQLFAKEDVQKYFDRVEIEHL